jgi:hypothetical protein
METQIHMRTVGWAARATEHVPRNCRPVAHVDVREELRHIQQVGADGHICYAKPVRLI